MTERRGGWSRSLVTGALLFRWVWLIWMTGLAAVGAEGLVREPLAWASIGAAAAWTVWLTVLRSTDPPVTVLVFDVALCAWLVLASGLVVPRGDVISGRPFFATGFPLSAPLLAGAVRGPLAGVAAAVVLGVAHLLSRPINDVALAELSPGQVQNVTGAMLNYLVAGLAVGLVARLLHRSDEAVRAANEEVVRERERAARLSEREALARAIHDSVLQSLSLVHKRGRELARRDVVPPGEVGELADVAGRQEAELRALILRDPQDAPSGTASLRDALEACAREVRGLPVTVSATGPIWTTQHCAGELSAAVGQALQNVIRHAQATSATVFAEEEDGVIRVSVRDDGRGFSYDEASLKERGKVGILKSIKGRVEELGGSFAVSSAPGRGTEIELEVPKEER